MFLLITPDNRSKYENELKSMYRLRHRIFIEQLRWPSEAIQSVDGMEFDQFDMESTHYIVRLNDINEVDACTRLLPTTGPNLLCDVFPDLIETMPAPNSSQVWETSRFCADNKTAPRNIVALLVAAMLEFGNDIGMKHYVSVSDIRIEPMLRRAGWPPTRLGAPQHTGTDMAAAEIYEVSLVALQKVRTKNSISYPLLDDKASNRLVAA